MEADHRAVTKELRRPSLRRPASSVAEPGNSVDSTEKKQVEDDTLAAYLGLAAYEAGNYSDAISYLARVELKNPHAWQVKFVLAQAYFQAGRPHAAIQEFRFVARWCPDSKLRARAESAMANIVVMPHG